MTPQPDSPFVHRFEPATAQRTPYLLLLHGTGGDENSLIPLGQAIAPGAALLSVRGQVMEQNMARFFRRPAEGLFDRADLDRRTRDLGAFVQHAKQQYQIPSGKLVVAGFSNGAVIGAHLFLNCPGLLAGALLMRGMAPFSPQQPVDLERRPVLLLNSTDDPYVATDEVDELTGIFRAANAEVTLHWENAGHALCQGDYLMAFDWLRRFYSSPAASQ